MLFYHGSNVIVNIPKILSANRGLDFGVGFYTTTNIEQAERFAVQQTMRRRTGSPIINIYDFDLELHKLSLDILTFETADHTWLDFVLQNRLETCNGNEYDIIVGPVANDKVYDTLRLFEIGRINRKQALEELKVRELYNQYVFSSEKALNLLSFIESKEVQ